MPIYKPLAAIFFTLGAFAAAYACTCIRPGPPCDYYSKASAIFLGRVVGSAERKSYVDEQGNKTVYDVGKIRFLVQENYKGASGYEVEIHSGTGGGDCGYWFLRNESYVVYAYQGSEDDKLFTSICTRTRHVTAAEEDLEFLRGLPKAKPGGTLYGVLRRLIGDSYHGPVREGPTMAGVKIILTGQGRTIETSTNQAGEYRVTGLPPGDYEAFPQLPDNLGAVSNRDKRDNFGRFTGREPVTLADQSCAEISFSVQFSGMVSGKVVDAVGEPANQIQVNLVAFGDGNKEWWTWTDKEGHYEFQMVQPGSYLLGFNLKWAPDKDDPYPKTFYPGVKTRWEASLISVSEGENLKGYDMTLPPRLHEHQLKVTVVWPDGSPAVNVAVDYQMNEAWTIRERSRKTDEKGTVILSLFENYYYIIYADTERKNKETYSPPIKVFVDKNLEPLKLVLVKEADSFEEKEALRRPSPN